MVMVVVMVMVMVTTYRTRPTACQADSMSCETGLRFEAPFEDGNHQRNHGSRLVWLADAALSQVLDD
jgi:hypothetical protein